jgi:hypothetical protein
MLGMTAWELGHLGDVGSMSGLPESGYGSTIYERAYAGSRPFERTKLEPLSKRRSFDSIDIVRRRDRRKTFVSVLEALGCSWKYAKAQPTAAVRRAQSRSAVRLVLTTCACLAAMLLLVVPLLTLEADARGGGGHGGGGHGGGGHGGGGHGGFGGHRGGMSFGARGGGGFRAAHIGRARIGGAHIAARSVGVGRSQRASVAAARLGGAGNRFTAASAHRLGGAAARMGDPGRRVFGNRAIANVALQSQFGQARSTAGSSVRPGLGGVAGSFSAGSDRCSGLTPITTCSITFTGRIPMTTSGPMLTTTSITASTVLTPITAPLASLAEAAAA